MFEILITPRSYASTSTKPLDVLLEQGYKLEKNDTGKKFSKEDMKRKIKGKDGVILGTDPLDSEVLDEASDLKVISKYGVGLDNVDVDRAEKMGVEVRNTPGANSESVAELAFGFVFSLARRIPEADRKTKNGFEGKIVGNTVSGKKLGIIGLGSIGSLLAQKAEGFGMDVYYYDVERLNIGKEEELNIGYRSLEEILEISDFVSIHAPLNEATENMIAGEELKKMKNNSYLINTSRERIINERDLFHALEDDEIAGAALDEFEFSHEDIPASIEDKIVLSPHMGAHTEEAIENMGVQAAENLISVLEKK